MRSVVYLLVACVLVSAWDGEKSPVDVNQETEDDLSDILGQPDYNVDRWEAVPLPPPSEADLIRDSDELYQMNMSEVRRMMEQEAELADAEDQAVVEAAQAELEAIEGAHGSQGVPEMPFIFNTDDFDDDYDDVAGDAPLAPPLR